MNASRSLVFAFAIAGAAVVPAMAQSGPNAGPPVSQQRFFTVLRSISMSEDQRNVIRGIIGDGYLSGQTDDVIDGRIFAVLDSEQARALRTGIGFDNAAGGYEPHHHFSLVAVIHKVSGDAITLTNGRTVFMRDATQIVPSRDALKPGVRIGVDGQSTKDANVNAYAVRAFDENPHGQELVNATAGARLDAVAKMTKSSITLAGGNTVFLRDDTVFAPSRDLLQPGARIAIYGVPAGNGNVNADRVEIVPSY